MNVDVRACYDDQGRQTVDFTADFNAPLPIQSDEFDGVFCQFAIEHLSWRTVKQFMAEMLRVLKPGGRVAIVTANTEAQMRWIQDHPEGWDGKDAFDSASCVLFGDNDYPENSHRAFFNPAIITDLLRAAGFEKITVQPYGERDTDMCADAIKPQSIVQAVQEIEKKNTEAEQQIANISKTIHEAAAHHGGRSDGRYSREALFDKEYFNGGKKIGGYAREGIWDFPCHEISADYILSRKPDSVLEVGAARGYVLKRIQDAGIEGAGLEISKHCWLTRVCDGIQLHDLCETLWPMVNKSHDLCYSIAVLEHIPQEFLPAVIKEMARTCARGLHGVDFGEADDGFDRSHVSLFSKSVWESLFAEHAPGWPVEIVNKEELETGGLSETVYRGDGKVKLNIGCGAYTMFHHGWINIDNLDFNQQAGQHRYHFRQLDAREGLPWQTKSVDLIFASHFIEHLSYADGVKFLRDCRRIIKPTGAMRLIMPDARLLCCSYAASVQNPISDLNDFEYADTSLDEFDHINDWNGVPQTACGKLWALLFSGHQAAYDAETLLASMRESGWDATVGAFRVARDQRFRQILSETCEMSYGLSLFVDAVPAIV